MNDEGGCLAETPRARRNTRLDVQEIVETQASARRTILITPLDHGFTVNVGCQAFAIEDPDKLTKVLNAYLKNPREVEVAWTSKDKNDKYYPAL